MYWYKLRQIKKKPVTLMKCGRFSSPWFFYRNIKALNTMRKLPKKHKIIIRLALEQVKTGRNRGGGSPPAVPGQLTCFLEVLPHPAVQLQPEAPEADVSVDLSLRLRPRPRLPLQLQLLLLHTLPCQRHQGVQLELPLGRSAHCEDARLKKQPPNMFSFNFSSARRTKTNSRTGLCLAPALVSTWSRGELWVRAATSRGTKPCSLTRFTPLSLSHSLSFFSPRSHTPPPPPPPPQPMWSLESRLCTAKVSSFSTASHKVLYWRRVKKRGQEFRRPLI